MGYPGELVTRLMTVVFVGYVGVCCWREMFDSISLELFTKLAFVG